MRKQLNSFGMGISKFGIFIMLMGLMTGCDEDDISVPPNADTGEVAVQFKTAASSSNANRPASAEETGEIMIEGTNGTLLITDVHFIVDDFELDMAGNDQDEAEGENENMEGDHNEFESGPFFVDMPLDGELLELATAEIAEGTYTTFEFEIDDLDMDEEEDAAEEQEKAALMSTIQTEFSDWPESASMVISGTFISNQGDGEPFLAYAEAEVSIEKELVPPMEIDNASSHMLNVIVDPAEWFTRADGSVINLTMFDYASTGTLLELEVEMENGFVSVEVGELISQTDVE